MEAVRKLVGMYLVAVATVVAVWFIVNTLFVNSFNVSDVWFVLDILMVVGLAVAVMFNYDQKRRENGRPPGEPITRRYLEVNIALYLTLGITILFLHSWIAFLKLGLEADNHQAWVIWAVVDTLLPLTLGVTGCRMLKDSAE